jgi:hypothetical protein
MNKLLSILLILFVNPAFATWTFIGRGDASDIFYEYESIKKEGNIITTFVYIRFTERQKTGELSSLYQIKFECGKDSEMLLTYAKIFSDAELKNLISEASGEIKIPASSKSPFQTLYKFLCHL